MYTVLILKYADKYKPFKYNTKYSNKFYPYFLKKSKIFLNEHIFNVLGDIVTWKALIALQAYTFPKGTINLKTIVSNHEYHYSFPEENVYAPEGL